MKKMLSVEVEGYTLKVDEIDDWLDALAEIELGRIKIQIAKAASLDWPFDVTSGMTFSCSSVTLKEQIVCALILKYPKGLSKTDLQRATGMNPDSLATYLTSKQERIADWVGKENDEYGIKADRLSFAVAIAKEALMKCSRPTSLGSKQKDSDVE